MLANKTLINGLYVGCMYSKACFYTENTVLLPITMENVRYCQRVLFFPNGSFFALQCIFLLKQPKEKKSFFFASDTKKHLSNIGIPYMVCTLGCENFCSTYHFMKKKK